MNYAGNRVLKFLSWAVPASLVIFTIYMPVFYFGFVWDDDWLLWRDATLHPTEVLAASWTYLPLSDNYFRPLVMLSFAVDRLLFDNLPGPMHLHNLLFHCLNSILVGSLVSLSLERIRGAFVWYFPLLAALLFGLHPMLVESVAWISCRFDVYVTFFILLFLNLDLIVKSIHVRVFLSFILFMLAALSKEMAATLPVLYILFRMMIDNQSTMSLKFSFLRQDGCFSVLVAMILSGITYLALRYSALDYLHKEVDVVITGARFGDYLQHVLLVAKTAGAFLLFSVAGGAYVTPMHYQKFPVSYYDPLAWFSLIILIVIFVVSVAVIVRGKKSGYVLPIYILSCLPVLNIVFWPNADDLIQERFLNFPLALLFSLSLVALGSERFFYEAAVSVKKRLAIFGLCSLLLVNAAITCATLPIWKNHVSLWSWAVHRAPGSVYANLNMAISYMIAGDIDRAKHYASVSNRLRPESAIGNSVLAAIALDEKEYAQAIHYADEKLAKHAQMLERQVVEMLYIKALALQGLHRTHEARDLLVAILNHNRKDYDAAFALGNLFSQQGEHEKANACWFMALAHMTAESASKRFSDGVLHLDQIEKAAQGANCID